MHQYGGYLCRIGRIGASDPGGTFLLFWGAPTSYENDLSRVLRFVLELQSQINIPLRAGITHAVVYAGFIGSALREEYTCYGSSVNQAARQMTMAGWGQILLDDETARRGQDEFEVTMAGRYALKGLADKQPLFELTGQGIQNREDFYGNDFIGRSQEVAQLQDAVAPIFAGHFGGVTVVSGEAGIGKSRFVSEALGEVIERGAQTFLCQTDEILRESLNPFRYFLRRYFEQSSNADESVNRANFDARLETLVEATTSESVRHELARTRSFLGALVNLYWPNSLYEQLEPQLRFENTLSALKTLILAESQRQPTVLVLEDAHWIDEDSRGFLTQLTRNVQGFRFVILVTTRPIEEVAALLPGLVTNLLPLTALSGDESTALAWSHLGGPISPELLTLLVTRSEGNPFFMQQLLLYLQEEGFLLEGESGWQLVDDAKTDSVLSTDLQTVLVARLDRLAQGVKQMVQTAAVLGREFSVQILSQMLSDEQSFDDKVQSAEESAVWKSVSEWRYLFSHALLRDAAYEMQLRTQLQSLHQSAAQAIETLFTVNLAPHYADLVYHSHAASDKVREQKYAHLAGEQAAARYENSDAISYLSRVLALTPATDIDLRYEILLLREDVLNHQGARDRQADDLAILQELADGATADAEERMRRPIEVLLRQARYLNHTGRHAESVTTIEKAIHLSIEHKQTDLEASALYQLSLSQLRQGDHAAALSTLETIQTSPSATQVNYLEARILNISGIINLERGDYNRAKHLFEQANAAFRQLDKLADLAGVIGNLAILYDAKNEYALARAYCEESRSLYQQIGQRRGHANQLETLGNLAVEQGDFAQANDFYTRSLQMKEDVGDLYGISVMQVNLGYFYIRLGDMVQARQHLEPCLKFTREAGTKLPHCYALNYLAYISYTYGDNQQAEVMLHESLEVSKQIGVDSAEGDALCCLAKIYRYQQRIPEAEATYTDALTIFQKTGQEHKTMEPLTGLAEIELQQGQLSQALAKVEDIVDYTKTRFPANIPDPFQIYWNCYRVLLANEDQRSAMILHRAYALLQTHSTKIENEELRYSFLNNIASHRSIIQEYSGAVQN